MFLSRLGILRRGSQLRNLAGMEVVIVPCLSDNYSYLILDDGSDSAIVVDPSETQPVVSTLKNHNKSIAAILAVSNHTFTFIFKIYSY